MNQSTKSLLDELEALRDKQLEIASDLHEIQSKEFQSASSLMEKQAKETEKLIEEVELLQERVVEYGEN